MHFCVRIKENEVHAPNIFIKIFVHIQRLRYSFHEYKSLIWIKNETYVRNGEKTDENERTENIKCIQRMK